MKFKGILLFLTLIIFFQFQFSSKGNELSDFQIEGISLKDSALDYFDKNEILDRKEKGFVYEKKDFFSATFYQKNFYEFYDNVQLHLKKDDNKYIIYSVGGQKSFDNYQNKCFEKMDEILNSIKTMFPNTGFFDDGIQDWTSSKNKGTKVKSYYLTLKSGDEITIQCYDHPNDSDSLPDTLLIALDSKEFVEWLYD